MIQKKVSACFFDTFFQPVFSLGLLRRWFHKGTSSSGFYHFIQKIKTESNLKAAQISPLPHIVSLILISLSNLVFATYLA